MTFSTIKKIFIDWFIVSIIIIIALNLKGLYKYIMNPSDYVITYNLCDYYKFLITIVDLKVNYFAAVTAILSAFISLAIPLSINQISTCLKDYKDKEVSKMFFEEHIFNRMFFVLFFLLLSLIAWYFINSPYKVGFLLLSFVILTLYYSFHFFNRVIEYVTATDDVVHDYFYKNAKTLFDFDKSK